MERPPPPPEECPPPECPPPDRKSTRLNSSHLVISYAVFCLKKKKNRVQDADGGHVRDDIRHRPPGGCRGSRVRERGHQVAEPNGRRAEGSAESGPLHAVDTS